MLIDAGEYTLDITLNEILDDYGNIKQISPPSGGSFGSININLDIIKLIEEIFGKNKIDYIKDNYYHLWELTLDSIEKKKKTVSYKSSDSKEIDIFIDTRYPESFCKSNNCFKTTSYGNIRYNDYAVYIPIIVFKNIIFKNSKKIIEHIKEIIQITKERNINIDLLVITGGYSKNDILINEIMNLNYTFQQLLPPEISVMKGSVLYGKNPGQIVSRIAPFTVGTSVMSRYIYGTICHSEDIKNGAKYCKYFDPFVKRGDEIKNNENITKIYYPHSENQTKVFIDLYFSKLINPVYIFLNESVANFTLNSNETNLSLIEREIEVTMNFGSCITLSAKNKISGEKMNVTANYYLRND